MPRSTPTTTTAWPCASRWWRWAACQVRINDPGCVAKTFPDYFERFAEITAKRRNPGDRDRRSVRFRQRHGGASGGRGAGLSFSGQRRAVSAGRAGRAERRIDLGRRRALAAACRRAGLRIPRASRCCSNGTDVTAGDPSRRGLGGCFAASPAVPTVRAALLDRQRAFCRPPGLVADGRDMGSVVFPDASLKVFLTASSGGARTAPS